MKKLLTLLLTLVMAICLVNLNNSHTKAEGNDTPVSCEGISYDPTNGWRNGSTVLTDDQLNNIYGITYTDQNDTFTVTLSKSLTCSSDYETFSINNIDRKTVNINLSNDITLSNTSNPYAHFAFDITVNNDREVCTINILGNNHSLTLISAGACAIDIAVESAAAGKTPTRTINFNDVKLDAKQTGNNLIAAEINAQTVNINGDSELQFTNNLADTNAYALTMNVDPIITSDYSIRGKANLSDNYLKFATRAADGAYQVDANENNVTKVNAKYIVIKKSKPFTITATEDGTKVQLAKTGTVSSSLQYKDGVNDWTDYGYGTEITLNKGESVSFKAKQNVALSSGYSNYVTVVVSTGKITASGNIMSLVDGTNFVTNVTIPDSTDGFCFHGLFKDCANLVSIDGLELPATTLKQKCYYSMFEGCTGLTSIPSSLLPATTLTYCCYSNMFKDCTGLTSVPSNLLPATSLTSDCYESMFAGCTNLTNIPDLPATTLQAYCYQSMFYGCSKLKVSATKTGNYQIKLHIPASANDATKEMFTGTGGTFVGTPSFNTDYYIATPSTPKECSGGECSITTTKGSGNIVAHIDTITDPSKVITLDCDTKPLTNGKQYALYKGSVGIIFNKSFIDTLGVGNHLVNVNYTDGTTKQYPITITINDVPSPSPSKKDESCEKVIGPTWHWNNSKGICEDYGVVGTATR